MTISAVQGFYADNIANLTALEYADGAFGDSGCGKRPSWLCVFVSIRLCLLVVVCV